MKCAYCDANAVYRAANDAPVCLVHARLTVTPARDEARAKPLTVRPAIETLARYFWGETEVDCFGQSYDVLALPAFVVETDDDVVGCLVYAVEGEMMTVVMMLNVLPAHQGIGVGSRLLQAAIAEARSRGLAAIRVATTNDDLPALALYQKQGFRLTGLLPGLVAHHHGEELAGFSGIPIRDEIQLRLTLH
jgi:ribosomal protein S18 acetylase RimI-like enzyme